MKENAQTICNDNFNKKCRAGCPLSEACKYRGGDTREIWVGRVNAAANELAKEETK